MIKFSFKKEMHTPHGKQWLDLDLKIGQGEFISLFGPSGAGKTTILRILAGLTQPQEGLLEVNGEVWFDSRRQINWPVQRRRVGFVFQENNLFPHMTVVENLAYACRSRDQQRSIQGWMTQMGLTGLETQKPDKLSSGQKQRLALGRALIGRPEILLLDEPLSGLDSQARLSLQDEIIRIYDQTKITTILVSHDLPEVFKLSQKVYILKGGKLIRSGTPQEVFIDHEYSGKFRFSAEIIAINRDGVVNILTLSIGQNITKVVASDEEIAGLTVGSQVIVAAKAFNPLILSPRK